MAWQLAQTQVPGEDKGTTPYSILLLKIGQFAFVDHGLGQIIKSDLL